MTRKKASGRADAHPPRIDPAIFDDPKVLEVVRKADDRIRIKGGVVKSRIEAIGWNTPEPTAADAAVGWTCEMGFRADRQKPSRARRVA
jgi:hypothetical protein